MKVKASDSNGRRVITDSNTDDEVTFFIENSSYVNPKLHIRDMEYFGIDKQILSLPPPSVDKVNDPLKALHLSKLINDEIAAIVQSFQDRFLGFATIPMDDPGLATAELERVVKNLGFKGIVVSSNTKGKFYDNEEYDSFFETLQKLDIPMFIHPTEPVTAKLTGQDYKLNLLFGWPFDSTLCASRLIFNGTFQKFPYLKVIVAHGGGMIPFFAGRIDMLARVAAGGGRKIKVDKPAESFKKLYFDTAIFSSDSLELLAKFAGVDHILYASDYPFGIDLGRNCYVQSIHMMENAVLNSKAKSKIFGENIRSLLNLN